MQPLPNPIACAALLIPALIAGCADLAIEPPTRSQWSAELRSSDETYRFASGSAAALSGSAGTEIGLTVQHVAADAALPWGVRLGTCPLPDAVLGTAESYPPLETGPTGAATLTVFVARRLDAGAEYHIEVLGPAGQRLLCGELEPVTP